MPTDPSKYMLNHTMLRIKDPVKSIKFFEFLGMQVVHRMDFPESKFSLYFMGYPNSCAGKHWTDCEGLVEMTHNYGSENDPNFSVATGNADPGRGFGHLCISVDNLQAACQRLEDAGYEFQKKLTDGRMKHIAFVKTPDEGYWVEIIGQKDLAATEGITETHPSTYRSNHSMVRVKDKAKALQFYQDVLGMEIIREYKNPENRFDLIFLAFAGSPSASSDQHNREAILELTYNYGSEDDPNVNYHNGNSDPKGFGHVALTVDDLDAACERFEQKGARFQKRLQDGRMRDVAFLLSEPDGYWIEVIQNERIKPRAKW